MGTFPIILMTVLGGWAMLATVLALVWGGRLRREQANKRHLLEGKSSRRTRRLTPDADVDSANAKQVKRLLGQR